MTVWAGGRYEAVAEQIAVIAEQTVAAADHRTPLRGAAVVDLACGTGSAALAAAARGATVTGVDLTPELLAIASDKAHDAGLDVTWTAADAADTGLPTAAFDVAVSNMGIIFVEPHGQVTELARLLKAVGTLAFSSWVRDAVNPFFDPIVAVFGPPPPGAFTPDQWGDTDTAVARLTPAFEDIEFQQGSHTWSFASMRAALHFISGESPMHVAVFRHADAAQRERLSAAFESALHPHVQDTGAVRFDTPYVVITARRR